MLNSTTILITVVSSCLIIQGAFAFSECTCTMSDTKFKGDKPKNTNVLSIDNNEYNFNEQVGKLIQFKSVTLFNHFENVQYFNEAVASYCPTGFDLLTKADLHMIFEQRVQYHKQLFGSDYLNLDKTKTYFTTTKADKSDPNFVEGQENYFYALTNVGEEYKITLKDPGNYFQFEVLKQISREIDHSNLDLSKLLHGSNFGICKLNPAKFQFNLDGYSGQDFEIEEKQTIKIQNKYNIKKWNIEIDNKKSFNTQQFEYIHTPEKGKRCVNVSIQVQLNSGGIVGNCFTFWTKPIYKKGLQNDITLVAESTLSKKELIGVVAQKSQHLKAPIAPINGENSSFLIFYSQMQDGSLQVQKVSSTCETQGKKILISNSGLPYDITTSLFEFFVLAVNQDSNKLWIASYSIMTGEQNWSRTIVENGAVQYQKDDLNILKMSDVILEKSKLIDGRLNYAKGQLQVFFTRSNPNDKDGYGRDMNREIFMYLNAENAIVQNVMWNRVSDSLVEPFHYEGGNFYFAYFNNDSVDKEAPNDDLNGEHSEDEVFSRNDIIIQICQIENERRCSYQGITSKTYSEMESKSSFLKVSQIFEINGNRDQKFFVYYRIEEITNLMIEVSLVQFSKKKEEEYSINTIFKGFEANNIKNLKVMPYGNKILLEYNKVLNAQTEDLTQQPNTQTIEQTYFVLLSSAGKKLNDPFKEEFDLRGWENWKMLENGAIVSSNVHSITGQVSVRFLPSLNEQSSNIELSTILMIVLIPLGILVILFFGAALCKGKSRRKLEKKTTTQ